VRGKGALEKEGVDMPRELSPAWVGLSSLHFRVENDIPFLKVLKASFFCSKNLPITAAIRVQFRLEGTIQIWWEFFPVIKSE